MKRLSIIFAAIGLSTGAFATLPTTTNPTEMSVPLLDGGFFIGVTGAYLQASGSNGANKFLTNVDLGYDWGWGANMGYIFTQTGNDVNLSYFHFDDDDTASATAPSRATSGTNILSIKNKAEYDLDQVDLTAGQYIDMGCRLRLHPNVGLQWADVEHKFHGNFIQSNPNPTLPNGSVAFSEKSDLDSIGPLVGIDANYYVGMGFGVVGHFDSALLMGDIDANAKASSLNFINPSTTVAINGVFKGKTTRRVVPVMDAKLGIDYTYLFNNVQKSDLNLEVAYQVSNYFNAVDMLSVSANGAIQGRNTSDMGLNGIYAIVTFHA